GSQERKARSGHQAGHQSRLHHLFVLRRSSASHAIHALASPVLRPRPSESQKSLSLKEISCNFGLAARQSGAEALPTCRTSPDRDI
ncbi:MAG TPA: hypothetical protein VLE26_04640, partial [Alphaproteobacteria bacterium]|nr:hypothetical protein [Alphaproteobacteria bacterium]